MRKLVILAIGVLMLAVSPAFAQADCHALTKISRINKTIIQNYRSHDPNAVIATISVIIVDTMHIDGSFPSAAFPATAQAPQKVVLTAYMAMLADVKSATARRDMVSAEILLKSPQTIILAYKLNDVLSRFGCNNSADQREFIETTAPKAAGLNAQPETEPPQAPESSDKKNRLLIAAAAVSTAALVFLSKKMTRNSGIGAGIFVVGGLIALFMRWKGERKLRLKRHELYYVVHWRKLGTKSQGKEGVILDINSFGAKLSLPDPPKKDDVGEILLSGQWYEARVQWSKEAACGLRLAQRLPLIKVYAILKESRDPNFKSADVTA